MPTNKPRVTFAVDKEMFDDINEYRFQNRLSNQSQAVLSLISAGLESMGVAVEQPEDTTEWFDPMVNAYKDSPEYIQQAVCKLLDIPYTQPRVE